VQNREFNHPCEVTTTDIDGNEFETPGVCVDGRCVYSELAASCDGISSFSAERTVPSCDNERFYRTWRFRDLDCPRSGTDCFSFGPMVGNLTCYTSQTADDPDHSIFDMYYQDENMPECLIGASADLCRIHEPGTYHYMGMVLTWSGPLQSGPELRTVLEIDVVTKTLVPRLHCPEGFCRAFVECFMSGTEPCGRVVEECTTASPTASTTQTTTSASSHGDPIIWTFGGECYDLNKDGLYLASSHPHFDHDVYIGVYNDFMREVQVVNRTTDEIILSINSLDQVKHNKFPFTFERESLKCPLEDEFCHFFFNEYRFDAQHFQYVVHVQSHNYLDPALKPGESGVHLDIFPRAYLGFNPQHEYSGLYFTNPLPQDLKYCPVDSPRSTHHRTY